MKGKMTPPKNPTYAQVDRLIVAIENLARAAGSNTVRQGQSNESQVAATRMFESLEEVTLPQKTKAFIDDLRSDFDDYGSLSNRQMECLTDNYNKFINGIPFYR